MFQQELKNLVCNNHVYLVLKAVSLKLMELKLNTKL